MPLILHIRLKPSLFMEALTLINGPFILVALFVVFIGSLKRRVTVSHFVPAGVCVSVGGGGDPISQLLSSGKRIIQLTRSIMDILLLASGPLRIPMLEDYL